MSYATLEHYQWQMPKDKNTTSGKASWTCSSGRPKSTYKYYDNSADKADSCDPNCTGYCSPICTGPSTPGGYDTKDLVCHNVNNWRTVTCIPDDGLGGGSVDPRKAKCGLEFSHGSGPAPTFSDCQKMMSQLQNTVNDKGESLLAPVATCFENMTAPYYLIWGCEEPGGTCT